MSKKPGCLAQLIGLWIIGSLISCVIYMFMGSVEDVVEDATFSDMTYLMYLPAMHFDQGRYDEQHDRLMALADEHGIKEDWSLEDAIDEIKRVRNIKYDISDRGEMSLVTVSFMIDPVLASDIPDMNGEIEGPATVSLDFAAISKQLIPDFRSSQFLGLRGGSISAGTYKRRFNETSAIDLLILLFSPDIANRAFAFSSTLPVAFDISIPDVKKKTNLKDIGVVLQNLFQ